MDDENKDNIKKDKDSSWSGEKKAIEEAIVNMYILYLLVKIIYN